MDVALDQIRQAEEHKQEGNLRYKEGNYKKALSAYHKVFCYVNGLQAPGVGGTSTSAKSTEIPQDRVEDVKRLKQSTHLNMAACYLKTGDHRKCVDTCTKCLEQTKTSKAYFRRAQAYAQLRDFDAARTDLQRAQDLSPDNKEIGMELRRLRAQSQQAYADDKSALRGFLKSEGAEGEGAAKEQVPASNGTDDGHNEIPSAARSAEAVEAADADSSSKAVEEEEEDQKKEEEAPQRTIDVDARDEASKPEVTVRPLQYSWHQTDEDLKIYISFDQSEELQNGVQKSAVQVDFAEWSLLVVIQSPLGRPTPLGLRLGDFHRRIDPKASSFAVRSSRITLTMRKREKEHWFNLLQSVGS